MKIMILTIFIVSSLHAHAQTKTTYNTKINKANIVNIKSGNINIGQIIINQAVKGKVLLSSYNQIKDSTNSYVTTFVFSNSENLFFNNIDINMKFNKSVEDVKEGFNGLAFMTEWILSHDKKNYNFKALEIKSKTFSIKVKSQTPIETVITGVDGKIN